MPIEWLGDKFMRFVDREIEKRAHVAGQSMVAVAKSLVAVDTGLLQSRIYYTYQPATRTLTLHADTHYAMYQEFGTYKMRPHPYLRPALAVAGPSFVSGVKTQAQFGTSLSVNHVPRQILPHIRPHISAANKKFNKGIVRRTTATAIHMDRQNNPIRSKDGKIVRSTINSLHRKRKAWN